MPRTAEPILDRLNAKFTVTPTGCWQWTGPVSRLGYAVFRVGSRTDGSRRQPPAG